MKRTTVTKIMSIISILFIFSSMSYAATPEEWKKAHNIRRYWHGAPNVEWSFDLFLKALACAHTPYGKRKLNYSHCNYGENCSEATLIENPSAESVVAGWYAEENAYNYQSNGYTTEPDMDYFDIFGHFTQVVWKKSTKIGCATGIYGTVCNYEEVGNKGGAAGFKENVGYNYWRAWQALFPKLF